MSKIAVKTASNSLGFLGDTVGTATKLGVGTALGFSLVGPEDSRGKNISDSVFDSIQGSAGMTKYDLIGMAGNMWLEDNDILIKRLPKIGKAYSAPQDLFGAIDLSDPYNYNQVPIRGDLSAQANLLFTMMEKNRQTVLDSAFNSSYGSGKPPGCLGYYPTGCSEYIEELCKGYTNRCNDMKTNPSKYIWCNDKQDVTFPSQCTQGLTGPATPSKIDISCKKANDYCLLLKDNKDKLVSCTDTNSGNVYTTIAERCKGTTGPVGCPVPQDTSIRNCQQYKFMDNSFSQDIPHYYSIKRFKADDLDIGSCLYINPANFKEEITGPDGPNPLIPYQFMLNTKDCPSSYQKYYKDYYIKHHPSLQVLDCNFFDGYLDLVEFSKEGTDKKVVFTTDLERATTSCAYDEIDGKFYKQRFRFVSQEPQNGGKDCPIGTTDGMLIEKEFCPPEECSLSDTWYHEEKQNDGSYKKVNGWSKCFQTDYCSTFHSVKSLTPEEESWFRGNCPSVQTSIMHPTSNGIMIEETDSEGNILLDENDQVKMKPSSKCEELYFRKNYQGKESLTSDDKFYYDLFHCDQKDSSGQYDTNQYYQLQKKDTTKEAKYGGSCDNFQVRNNYHTDSVCKPQDCKLSNTWYHEEIQNDGSYKRIDGWSKCFQSDTCKKLINKKQDSKTPLNDEDKSTYSLFNCDQYSSDQYYQLRQKDITEEAKYGGSCPIDSYLQLRSSQDINSDCKPVSCEYTEWSSPSDCTLLTEQQTSLFNKPKGWYQIQERDIKTKGNYDGTPCGDKETDYFKLSECLKQDCVLSTDWTYSSCFIDSSDGIYKRMKTKQVIQPEQNGGSCNGPLIDYESCSSQSCQLSPNWSEWSNCSLAEDGKTFVRFRKKDLLQAPTANQSCEPLIERQVCQPQDCAVGNWSDWSSCFTKDGKRVQSSIGSIIQPSLYGGTTCPSATRYRDCPSSSGILSSAWNSLTNLF